MSCDLNTGRKVPCKDSVGGIQAVYFADFGTMGALTVTAGEVTGFAGSPEFFEFEVKGNSSLEQTITASRENGTAFYEQTLNLTLTKLDLATQQELVEIVKARPHIVVKDYNGNYLMVGASFGADCSGGTIVTGAGMGDLSGFTLTMSGQETLPAYFVDATAFETLISDVQINP